MFFYNDLAEPTKRHAGPLGWAGFLCIMSIGLPGSTRAQVSELQIAPSTVQLQPGERRSVLVTAFDAAGNVVTDAEFSWETDGGVVNVVQDQTTPNILYLEGVSLGRAVVRVASGGVTAVAEVTILGPDLSGIPAGTGETVSFRIEPSTVLLLPTEEVQLRPVFLNAAGEPAQRTIVTWRSLLQTVASVNETGRVVGISPGQGVIEGETPNGVVGRALVRVDNASLSFTTNQLSMAPLDSDTLQIVVVDQDYRTVANRQLRWASSDPTVLNVTPLGAVTAIRRGAADVIVNGFGQQHAVRVNVHAAVATMDISPSQGPVMVPLGGNLAFEAVLTADDGTPVPEAPIRWSLSDTTIARFNRESQTLTPITEGTVTLRVVGPAPGLEAEWSVSVVAGGVEIETQEVVLGKRQRADMTVWLLNTSGDRLQRTTNVTWSSIDSAVAVVDNGVLNAIGWGSTTVIARTSWGDEDSVRVMVQGELLVSATRSGSPDLYSLNTEAPDDLGQITSHEGAELAGRYSPDGLRVVFAATAGDNETDLFIADADGANQVPLTNSDTDEGMPSWVPDGRIVFQRQQAGVSHVWIMDQDGANPRMITGGRESSDQPDVSPDGTMVAFRRRGQIYVSGLDGSEPRLITDGEGRYRNPRWFPDGSLAYVAERRVDRATTRVIVKRDLTTGQEVGLTPSDWQVVEFAVSGDGQTLAVCVQETINEVLTQGLYLNPVGDVGSWIAVPRATELEQFLFPSFRW